MPQRFVAIFLLIGPSLVTIRNYEKIFLLLLLLTTTALIIFAYDPISIWSYTSDVHLKYLGVRKFQTQHFEFFSKNMCTKGKPCECVLLVHGIGDMAYTWMNVLKEPASTWNKAIHFYAPNLPGSSYSPRLQNKSDYAISKISEMLLRELPEGCEKWTLVGNSLGGWISARMALLAPHRIDRLLLEDAAGLDKDYGSIIPVFASPDAQLLKDFMQRAYAKPIPLPEYVFGILAARLKSMPVLDMLQAQTPKEFLDADLAGLRAKTALLWGAQDRVLPPIFMVGFKEKIPSASTRLAPQCGHLPHKECPQVFVEELNKLLN